MDALGLPEFHAVEAFVVRPLPATADGPSFAPEL
jgi:hypothetical protein